MKKFSILTALLTILINPFNLAADEGMWLPQFLKDLNEGEMQKLGCKLTADQIYSVNNSSLKDAIVLFGGGCTGEMVSNEGLLLTNHHCGYGSIQSHSSVEHNYLDNGFWAKNKGEELPTPGLTCTFVVRIDDVTKQVLNGVTDNMDETKRNKLIEKNSKTLEADAVKDTWYRARIRPYFYGNEYYMVVTETFKDVRLVGAPPQSIGKFGGETDNWMWPRHTGDFSVFRIYANEKNEPADYSPNNKPFKPRNFLNVSLKGYQKGDFTMTYGFPGRTFEYVTSHGIRMVTEISNPTSISIREKRLGIWMNDMKANDKVRLQYSSKYARISNYYKKFQGEDKGMRLLNTIAMKESLEKQFREWAYTSKQTQYGNLLTDFKTAYEQMYPLELESTLFDECGMGIELVSFANRFITLVSLSKNAGSTDEQIKAEAENLKKDATRFFKDYNAPTDEKELAALLKMYSDLSKTHRTPAFDLVAKKYKNDYTEYAEEVFENSWLVNEKKVTSFLNSYKRSQFKKIEKDMGFKLMLDIVNNYKKNIDPAYSALETKIDLLYRQWVKALREMQKDRKFWPDANSTLRVAYGTVAPYKPFDGALYDYKTTLSGVIEKMDNTNPEFRVPQKLVDLYNAKDFGQYAENGDVPVAFIASNHTTGGNSGSPLLDGEGRLLGLNFDTAWEGTMSNYHFNADRARNISVDIRYVLFIIDKFAGAGYLVDEMTLVK
ncbi:MAG: S46 family peptidase [Bacteroidetes bacterium]|nr:S46 family peptidase [Bacteroidota bacterium]